MAMKKAKMEEPKKENMMSMFMSGKKCDSCSCTCSGKWANVGWGLLLVGGLAHMLPVQMAPLLKWAMYGVSLQMVVGVVSVVLALYFLLGSEE